MPKTRLFSGYVYFMTNLLVMLIHIIYLSFFVIGNYLCFNSFVVVEWICWLNGQRKRAPTPEVLQHIIYIFYTGCGSPMQ